MHPRRTLIALVVAVIFAGRLLAQDEEPAYAGQTNQSKLPPEFRYDQPPKVRDSAVPVYPYELAVANVKGSANVVVVVGPHGKALQIEVLKATHPEFGHALTAAVEQFTFDPAFKDNKPTTTIIGHTQEFGPYREPGVITDRDFALIKRERNKPETIVSAGKLDVPLKPVSRQAPAFPLALAGRFEKGDALIEILVDEDGKVRLPRIVSASEPALGYSAAQAVSAWRFEPPKVNGKKAVARVRVPFKFSAPPAADRPATQPEPSSAPPR